MSDGEQGGQHDGRLLAGRYRLLSVVGSGGMGTVWRAHDETLDREVAVKEVVLHVSLSAEERENRHRRTLREARASARLNHPGVVTVHDVVDEDARPWIVMELVRARSLQDVIDEDGPLPPGRVAAIGRQIAGALRAAHAIGILHRDVKPANVLVGDDDRAVLTDFGIAQMAGDASLTRTGLIMGSPAYMSPERVAGDPAVPASDLWALGATLYAACEGRAPHHRSDAMAVLAAVLTQEPPPPRDAGPLAPVLLGLLARDPARRLGVDQAEEAFAAIASGHAADLAAAHIAAHGGTAAFANAAGPGTLPGTPGTYSGDRTGPGESGDAHGTVQAPFLPEQYQDGAAHHAGGATRSPGGTTQYPGGTTQYPGGTEQYPGGHGREPGGGRSRAKVLSLVAAALVTLAVLVPAGIMMWPDGSSEGATPPETDRDRSPASPGPSGRGPSRTTPAVKKQAPPSAAALPPGFTRATENGYTIGVPAGWTRTVQKNSILWIDPRTKAYVQVDRTPWQGDPYDHWLEWERQALADGKLEGFQRISVSRTTVGALPAADIVFTWSRLGGTRAVDRGVIVGGKPYAVVVAVPAARWNENETLVKNVLDTFRPSGVG